MKTSKQLFILVSTAFLILGCTQELSIADFQDDFKDYEVEYRIEGLLDYSDFSKSVIRIDRTILVTDTSLFNNRDDNGDWESFSDLNGNGKLILLRVCYLPDRLVIKQMKIKLDPRILVLSQTSWQKQVSHMSRLQVFLLGFLNIDSFLLFQIQY